MDSRQIRAQEIGQMLDRDSRDDPDQPVNPIKTCMKLIYEASFEKNPQRRSEISFQLSQFLTQQGGIAKLFVALVDFDVSSQKETTLNQRFLAVSSVITCLPKLCMPYEEYCRNIFAQLRPLIIQDNEGYRSLACTITKSMIESPNAKGKNIPSIILKPIFDCLKTQSNIDARDNIIVISNLINCHLPVKLFVDIFPDLLYLLAAPSGTTLSTSKPPLKNSLVAILNGLKAGAACCLIERTLFHDRRIWDVYSQRGDDNGVTIKVRGDSESVDHEVITKQVVSLLAACNNELLVLEFFFHFGETMWSAQNEAHKQVSASLIEPLLKQTIQEDSTELDILAMIANNSQRSLDLILRTLMNYVAFFRSTGDSSEVQLKLANKSIKSCLDILEVLTVVIRGTSEAETMIERCLPVLKELQAFWDVAREQKQESLYESLDNLVKKLDKQSSHPEKAYTFARQSKSERHFDEIMKDLNDSLVPVRVHALVRLKQMIMANDGYFVERIPRLYTILGSSLADEEPYVFLACINLMAEMAVRRTEEMLPKLLELHSDQELSEQHRINVGEVLVRLIKQLNETTPHYAQQVMFVLINGTRDSSELVRMSSLTNMGEVCRSLGDALGKYILDVVGCVQAAIDDDTIQVKCAAVDLLRTALSGLDRYKVESVQQELKCLYGLLRRLKCRTLDEKLCLQIDLALDELDRLARELLGVAGLTDGQPRAASSSLRKSIEFPHLAAD